MRLIDADRLKEYFFRPYSNEESYSNIDIAKIIDDAPTIQDEQWIPCSERLQIAEYGESDTVLVTECWREDRDIRFVGEAMFDGGNWCEPTGERLTVTKVLAWMPRPEPYKGGKKK